MNNSNKPHHVDYYKKPIRDLSDSKIDRSLHIYYIALIFIALIFGMVAGAQLAKQKSCTVTITDMQGTQHTITGKCDEVPMVR